jgi:hypothetical protein
MASTPPVTIADFKARFVRDFKYGSGPDRVMDSDINSAMADAMAVYNPTLFTTDGGKVAFLYATAHFLVTNVQAAGGLGACNVGLGVENESEGVLSGKSVGGVSLNYIQPPDIVTKNPVLLQFWKTDYGQKYLAMLVPKLVGPFSAVLGRKDAGVGPDVPFTDY